MVNVIKFSTATGVRAVEKLGLDFHVWFCPCVIKCIRIFLFYCLNKDDMGVCDGEKTWVMSWAGVTQLCLSVSCTVTVNLQAFF